MILKSNVLFFRYPESPEGGNLLVIPKEHEPGGRERGEVATIRFGKKNKPLKETSLGVV